MFDQTLIRVCLILGSFITAGYILRRVRHAKVQIEDTIFWLMFSAAWGSNRGATWSAWPSSPASPIGPQTCWAS